MSLLYRRTCSMGVCANAIGRASASVRISALRRRSYVTGEIDLAAVQGRGISERARAKPANVVHRNHL